jgi:hypothetical protein
MFFNCKKNKILMYRINIILFFIKKNNYFYKSQNSILKDFLLHGIIRRI